MRGRSYTPSPPRGYGRRARSPPRGRHGRGDAPTSLLVRNLRHDCRPEDLRRPFGQFGPLKDIYLPRDYYTGDPRGFGFVQYVDPADAADAKYQMDGQIFHGRELTVVFAEENRKRPTEMRARERGGREAVFMIEGDHRRVILVPPDIQGPPHHDMEGIRLIAVIATIQREDTHVSVSPLERRYSRERSYSRSRSRSRSPDGSRSRSQSLDLRNSLGRARIPSRSRSMDPYSPEHSRETGSRSPSRE
ncbi:Arginine/serine-rich splicing factor scl25a transcript I [Orobanche gracilis]